MFFYQTLIREIAQDLNPAGVEASMRLQYGTLDALPRQTFVEESAIARQMEEAEPGVLRRLALSMGLGADFDRWEA
jgi:hypothetical protein